MSKRPRSPAPGNGEYVSTDERVAKRLRNSSGFSLEGRDHHSRCNEDTPPTATTGSQDGDEMTPTGTLTTDLPIRAHRIFLSKQHNIKNHFSVFNALLDRVDILLEIVKFLPPGTIRNLYSISAPFHYQFNSHYGSFILAATRIWAPQAETIHPWRCYGHLCIPDPAQRLPSTHPSRAADPSSASTNTDTEMPDVPPPHLPDPQPTQRRSKMIPSLRWLTMVVYRTLIIREIAAHLTASGFPVPARGTSLALRKMWLLLDLQTNIHRIALIQNEDYFTKYDLYFFLHLCVKLDMHYTDPVAFVGGEGVVRKYLLGERTFSTMWDWLRGVDGTSKLDVLRLWVRHGYGPVRRGPFPETAEEAKAWEGVKEATVVGVPVNMCGRWGNELLGRGPNKLLRPDQLVMREGVRRRLELQRYM